jgi:hypothetical protein
MVAIAASLAAGLTSAAPMGFKSSFMAMGDVGPNWKEGWVKLRPDVTRRDRRRRRVHAIG